jgi:hypothetical protein
MAKVSPQDSYKKANSFFTNFKSIKILKAYTHPIDNPRRTANTYLDLLTSALALFT